MDVQLLNDGYLGLLSDEVVLMILKHLSSTDLFNVLKACRRLKSVAQEECLWTEISISNSDKVGKLQLAILRLLSPKTKKVKVSSHVHPTNRGYRTSFPPSLCSKLVKIGENLTELRLVHQLLDGKYFRLMDLPKPLKVLDMSGSVVTNLSEHCSFFKDVCQRFTDMETLELSFCPWVTAHSLMAISKLPSLENLKLRGCRAIGECLAYVALSSRFGFHKLKVLDVTDTRVGSTEFIAFAGIPTLEEFYLGQYDTFVDHNCNYIKDPCITRIRNNSKLRILDISGSRITDRALETLRSVPNLSRVEAHFTFLSEEAIESFHTSKPNCLINKAPRLPEDSAVPDDEPSGFGFQDQFLLNPAELEMLPGIVVAHAGGIIGPFHMGQYINLVMNQQQQLEELHNLPGNNELPLQPGNGPVNEDDESQDL